MPTPRPDVIVRHLRRLATAEAGPEVADRELLRRFAVQRDEAAFTELVRRHGAMVLRVCRRVMPCLQDAEDAFQAAFLVLARQAGSTRWQASVANWLYGVAYRLSLKARAAAARRKDRESQAPDRQPTDPLAEIGLREAQAVLDEELARLPEQQRAPLVLCYLEGDTRDEAARQLGWSLAKVKRRLERGKRRLADRLARRGLTLSSALCAAALGDGAIAAGPLGGAAARAAVALVVGKGAGDLSARVVALADAVKLTVSARLRLFVVLCLAVGVALAGAGLFARQEAPPAPPSAQAPPAAKGPGQDRPKAEPPAAGVRIDDPLPPGAVARLGTTRFRLSGGVYAAAFSPDGKMLAVGSEEGGLLHLWEVPTGRKLHTLDLARQDGVAPEAPRRGAVTCVAFSPDGKFVASPTGSQYVVLWEVASGRAVRLFHHPRVDAEAARFGPQVDCVAFSPDGRTLLSGTRGWPAQDGRRPTPEVTGRIVAWDAMTGQHLWSVPTGPWHLWRLACSPDGTKLAFGGADALTVLDAATRKQLHRWPASSPTFAFAADGKSLCYRQDANRSAGYAVRDLATGKALATLQAPDSPAVVATPQGRLLVLPKEDVVAGVWDVLSARRLCALEGLRGSRYLPPSSWPVWPVAVSPDGKILAVTVDTRTVQLHDLRSGKEVAPQPSDRLGVNRLSFSADGKRLVSSGRDAAACVWDVTEGKLLRRLLHPDRPVAASLSPDGERVATVGGSRLVVWDAATGRQRRAWTTDNTSMAQGYLTHVCWSPDGKRLVTAEGWGEGSVWDAATGKLLHRFKGKQPKVCDIALSGDGRGLATAGQWGVCLWDTNTGQFVRHLNAQRHQIDALAFAPDGRTVAEASGGQIRLVDAETGKEIRLLEPELGAPPTLAFSADGRTLAFGTGWPLSPGTGPPENLVVLLEVATGKERRRFTGHRDEVKRLAFAPDGRLVSASMDNTILFWPTYAPRGQKQPMSGFDTLWADLASEDGVKAYDAVCALIASPGAPEYLGQRLPPPTAARARAIDGLIADLDSKEYARRARATVALKRLGWQAEPALRRALQTQPTEEKRRRLQGLLAGLDAASRPGGSAGVLRQLRALEVLEQIGSAEAKRVLEEQSRGTLDARLTEAARAALQRLGWRLKGR